MTQVTANIHLRAQETCIQIYYKRAHPHNEKNGSDDSRCIFLCAQSQSSRQQESQQKRPPKIPQINLMIQLRSYLRPVSLREGIIAYLNLTIIILRSRFCLNEVVLKLLTLAHLMQDASLSSFRPPHRIGVRNFRFCRVHSSRLTFQYFTYYHIIFKSMINIHHLILVCAVFSTVWCLRQSDLGSNDWSRQNIGRITELNFAPYNTQTVDNKNVRQFKNLFYRSALGNFGHLNRKTGEIESRESLGPGERVIESDDKELVILTQNGQILRYNKFTMTKSVDNRISTKQIKNIHSYTKANNKVYIADDKFIHEFQSSPKKVDELSLISVPSGSVFLKIFASTQNQVTALYALIYSTEKQEVCLNEVKEGGLLEKHCLNAKLGANRYAKIFTATASIYFGDESDGYYLNFVTNEWQKFNSKPVSFSHSGVKFENGLSFTSKGIADEKFIVIESNRNDKIVYGELTSSHLHIHLGSQTQIQDKVAVLSLHGRDFGVSQVWLNFLTHNDIEVIVLFEDLQLVLYSYEGKQFKQVWSREESLAYVEKVLFMKYKGYQDHLNNPYHMKMDDTHYIQLPLASKLQQIPLNFLARLKSELQDVYNFVVEKIEGLIGTFTNPQAFEELLNIKGYLKSTISSEDEKKHGLQKYIIMITSYNTMFAVDSKSGNVIWKKKYGTDVKLVALIKLKQQYEKEIAIAINYKYHITYVTQIDQDGTVTELEEFQTITEPTVHKISVHSILLRAGEKVHRFDVNKDLFGAEKEYSFYSIQEDARKILGWKATTQDLIQTWNFQLPKSERILKATSSYRGQPEANLPLVNDKKVLFKNVDFSNLAVLTIEDYKREGSESGKFLHRLHLYIINGLTGTVLFSQYQTGLNPNLPINLVYDQHNAIVSYYNTLNRVYQVWSIQSFQTPQESQLISKKYQPLFQKDDIIFMSKVYGTVLPIKHLFISESKQALLKRNLLIITRENKIVSIPRELVSTRRPKTNEPETNANSGMAEYITSKYPPEEYILPVNTLSYLNYNKELADLNTIRFSSTDWESTIFILAHGIDLFLIRTAPDKAFDMLADGFNYLQLLAVMVAVTVGVIFFKNKAKQAKLKKAHLD